LKKNLNKIFSGVKNFLKSKHHPVFKAVIIFVFLLFVINTAYYFASSNSKSCLMCHYMKPYYEQSHASTHKDISCVTCHPNRRLLFAPYFLRYIAGSYNPRPRAEVDDDICLDCHKQQNLKKSTAFAMNISFNHSDHLQDLKRGKKLRCTSCHARGETEHFKIDKNVCYTCHFKGAVRGHSVTNCNVCHGSPRKTVEHGGFQFDHSSYLKIGVECAQCHIDVVKGNADVEKKRCFQCHVERLEEFSNVDKIHSVHITNKGVDCEECHNSIEHGKIKMISSLEANCEGCHQLKHSPQREMYIGGEGRGVTSTPSRMFAAQVSCEGCHVDINKDGKSDFSEKRESCIKCHDKDYGLMLDKWISSMNEAVNKVEPDLQTVRKSVMSAKSSGKNVEGEFNYLTDAEFNLKLVKEGRGVHNIDYALKLIENISSNIEGIMGRLGNKSFKANRPKFLTDDAEYCNLCHSNIPSKNTEEFQGEKFPHQRHSKYLKCTSCHSREEHKKITITKDGCTNCHKDISKMPDNMKYGSITFPHSLHIKKKGIDCLNCHATPDFNKVQIKKNACTNCHHKEKDLRKDCGKCHSLQNNIFSGLINGNKREPDVMKSAGVNCEGCHVHTNNTVSKPKQYFCADCHDASYKDMQSEWQQDISSKSGKLSSLISQAKKTSLTSEEKSDVANAEKLISTLKSDKSRGMHNYMMFTGELDKSIKLLSTITQKK